MPLSGKALPAVKTLHLAAETDFPDHCRPVAILLQDLLKWLLVMVQGNTAVYLAIRMTALARRQSRTTGGIARYSLQP